MKRRKVLRYLIGCGVAVCLFCATFAVAAQAMDTPWISLQPDSGTTSGAPGSTPGTSGPASDEPEQVTEEPASDGTRQPETEEPGGPVTTAPTSSGERGCKSTAGGWAILIPISFAAVRIGGKKTFQKGNEKKSSEKRRAL